MSLNTNTYLNVKWWNTKWSCLRWREKSWLNDSRWLFVFFLHYSPGQFGVESRKWYYSELLSRILYRRTTVRFQWFRGLLCVVNPTPRLSTKCMINVSDESTCSIVSSTSALLNRHWVFYWQIINDSRAGGGESRGASFYAFSFFFLVFWIRSQRLVRTHSRTLLTLLDGVLWTISASSLREGKKNCLFFF